MTAAISALQPANTAMASALNAFPVLRACALRPRAAVLRPQNAVIGVKRPAYRSFADDKSNVLPEAENGTSGPNMDPAEHVSEEAAKMAKIQGGQGPDIEGQGTSVQHVSRARADCCHERTDDARRSSRRRRIHARRHHKS